MAKGTRRYNLRLIKATWPYVVPEIAEVLGVHEGSVLRWIKEGLTPNPGSKPYLIRGTELQRFLIARQSKPVKTCAQAELYCFKCRAPRRAYLDIVDIVIESPKRLRLKGLCAVCGTNLNKTQSARDLPAIRDRFNVQELTGEHLLERDTPNLNVDLEP